MCYLNFCSPPWLENAPPPWHSPHLESKVVKKPADG